MFDIILCEKPSQGRAYMDALGVKGSRNGYGEGNGYVVTWAVGHILQLAEPQEYNAEWKQWSLDTLPILPEMFKLKADPDKAKQLKIIKELLKKSRRCFIATDFDREGEAIARNILDSVNYKGEILRVKCSSYEPSDILKAMKNPLAESESGGLNRFAAQTARSRADWLYGMNCSRLFGLLNQRASKLKLGFVPSVGRVQTAVMGIAVEREKAIRNYKPKQYFVLQALISAAGQNPFKGMVKLGDLANEFGGLNTVNDAMQFTAALSGETATVTSFEQSKQNAHAPLPYTPSLLAKDAEKANITPDQTKEAYQALYEAGLITYPRTDNQYIPFSMRDNVSGIFSQLSTYSPFTEIVPLCDEDYEGKCWKDVDPSVSPHHGIVPTTKPGNALKGNQKIIYEMISTRFLMQFMPPKVFDVRKMVIALDNYDIEIHANSKVLIDAGWGALINLSADDEDESHDTASVPVLNQGEKVVVSEVIPQEKTTTKPKRFTQATLIEEMKRAYKYVKNDNYRYLIKEQGIGTEATQTDIVSGLIKKKLIEIKGKNVVVPSSVEKFIDSLPEEMTSPDVTAVWEMLLKEIENGNISLEEMMDEMTTFINDTVVKYRGN